VPVSVDTRHKSLSSGRAQRGPVGRARTINGGLNHLNASEHQRRTGIAQPPVECAQGRPVIGADSEMECISGAQAQQMLVRKAGRRAELQPPRQRVDNAQGILMS
jgi:hypothetical protein